jgi:hypothetical protein
MNIIDLVDEGTRLRTEIAQREKRLKEIEKSLRTHAEASPDRHIPLKDEDREGTRCILAGTGDNAVSIVFTADAIMQSIPDKSEALIDITTLAAGHLREFYRKVTTYEAVHVKSNKFDGKAFRASARELLPAPEDFITACLRKNKDGIPINQTRIEWG